MRDPHFQADSHAVGATFSCVAAHDSFSILLINFPAPSAWTSANTRRSTIFLFSLSTFVEYRKKNSKMVHPDCMTDDPNAAWWLNYTIWNGSQDQIRSYICRYHDLLDFKRICSSVESNAVLMFGIFGFLGGFWSIATLQQKSFRIADFFLFRLVGYLETVQMAVVTSMSIVGFLRCDLSYACTFFWAHVANTVSNVCADAVDLIVLFLCIERTVACVLPHFFHMFHSTNCWTMVAVWSLVIPLLFSLFQAFELTIIHDEIDNRYVDEPSPFSQTQFYESLVKINTIRFYVTAALIATATICSVIGFSLMARRKRKLTQNSLPAQQKPKKSNGSSPRSPLIDSRTSQGQLSTDGGSDVARRATKLQRDLCCLQLCLAIPVVINHMLYAMGLNTSYSFTVGKQAFEKNLSYESAAEQLDRTRSFIYLRLSTNISNVLGHGLHFYLYLLFSYKVRHGFCLLIKTCKRKILGRKNSAKKISLTMAEGSTRKTNV